MNVEFDVAIENETNIGVTLFLWVIYGKSWGKKKAINYDRLF